MSEEETRDDIIDIINNEEPVKEEIKEEPIKEEVKEEITEEEVKPKPKSKPRAKPKIKIVKEPIEEKPAPVVEEKPAPVKVDKLKQIVKCPDCHGYDSAYTQVYTQTKGFL